MLARAAESLLLQRLVDGAREGRGAALTIDGEPGVGKTVLLRSAIRSAVGLRIVTAVGVQAEQELPFAGLQQILGGLPDYTGRLPDSQARAIRVALGMSDDPPPHPFVLGTAVLGYLREAASVQPLLCAVDDVHWLDASTVQVLGFVARRLERLPIALLFAKRAEVEIPSLDAIPAHRVVGLGEADSLALVRSIVGGPVDESIAARIVEEARGNPLLITEYVRESSTYGDVSTFLSDVSLPIVSRLEGAFARRSARLPEATTAVMLLAAADPTGDPRLLARAAGLLGASLNDLIPAESAGLVRVGRRVTFGHPLVRSGVYQLADPERRRRIHAALAEATDRQRDPDRRAWHTALATFGPSESAAAALEHSAGRAGARGGFLAAAAFYERAAELAEDPSTRSRCALAAADALELAGRQPRALRVLEAAREDAPDDLTRARIDLVRGRLLLTLERSQRSVDLFLAAADALADTDPAASREAYLDALSAATLAAEGEDGDGIRAVAERSLSAPTAEPDADRAVDYLLDVMRGLALDPPGTSLQRLRRHLDDFAGVDESPGVRARWLWVACRLAAIGWDERMWRSFAEDGLAIARAVGALTAVAATRTSEAPLALLSADGPGARELVAEAVDVWESIAIPPAPYGIVAVAAWEGSDASEAVFSQALAESASRGEGMAVPLVHWARALHAVANGRYADALRDADAATRYPLTMFYSTWALVEAVEAAARVGDDRLARSAFDRLQVSTRASGTDWARGVEARAAALLAADPADAERLHQEALMHLSRTGLGAEVARAQLLYGEWLRRRRRRADARIQLDRAFAVFTAMGAQGFSSRVGAELAAMGGGSGAQEAQYDDLSTQEANVAGLASEGLSNAEIAVRLHLSASTVDYHLRKAFRKLGIGSRSRLHLALSERESAREPGRAAVSDGD